MKENILKLIVFVLLISLAGVLEILSKNIIGLYLFRTSFILLFFMLLYILKELKKENSKSKTSSKRRFLVVSLSIVCLGVFLQTFQMPHNSIVAAIGAFLCLIYVLKNVSFLEINRTNVTYFSLNDVFNYCLYFFYTSIFLAYFLFCVNIQIAKYIFFISTFLATLSLLIALSLKFKFSQPFLFLKMFYKNSRLLAIVFFVMFTFSNYQILHHFNLVPELNLVSGFEDKKYFDVSQEEIRKIKERKKRKKIKPPPVFMIFIR